MENILAKGEIARFQQETSNYSFCHYVFKKLSAAEASESVCMGERVKVQVLYLVVFQVCRYLYTSWLLLLERKSDNPF